MVQKNEIEKFLNANCCKIDVDDTVLTIKKLPILHFIKVIQKFFYSLTTVLHNPKFSALYKMENQGKF